MEIKKEVKEINKRNVRMCAREKKTHETKAKARKGSVPHTSLYSFSSRS